MRNSVILVDQIKQDIEAGIDTYEAIIGSAVRRFRPIVLTASAAVLALIPLAGSPFWGPMALAIMGGLVAATILTMTFLPDLYALAFGVPEESRLANSAAPPAPALLPAQSRPANKKHCEQWTFRAAISRPACQSEDARGHPAVESFRPGC